MSAAGLFSIRVSAKWVLTGEHAVLRGGSAIAFPFPERELVASFTPVGGPGFRVHPPEARDVVLSILGLGLGNEAPSGELRIQSTIPLGAGLGSSAAFAIALASWTLAWRGGSGARPSDDCARLAKEIEDRLHGGRSSGMDVAVILAGEPIHFRSGEPPTRLGLAKRPRFSLHDSGVRMATATCISRVSELRRERPDLADTLDARMDSATALAVEGLRDYSQSAASASGGTSALRRVAEAMRSARSCFEGWGLEPTEATALIHRLEVDGALAAKLTGAGGGGMVLALWPE